MAVKSSAGNKLAGNHPRTERSYIILTPGLAAESKRLSQQLSELDRRARVAEEGNNQGMLKGEVSMYY